MKDYFKRKRFLTLGYMYNPKCPCCNWTLHENSKVKKRIVNKQTRAKLKQDLRSSIDG